MKLRRHSYLCVCGRRKSRLSRRYCDRCAAIHTAIMSDSHRGKGTGNRTRQLPDYKHA